MRRKEREITDMAEICGIMDGCTVLRLGLYDESDPTFPYIVPVNFACVLRDGLPVFYFHGAAAGRKFDLMTKRGVCSFETESASRIVVEEEKRNITTYYASVMGKGKLRRLTAEAETLAALQALVDRFPVSRGLDWAKDCLPHTAVWELAVTDLTAKRNSGR